MSYSNPDRILINESFVSEITPQYMELSLSIEAAPVALGEEALKKVKEVAEFVEHLEKIGIKREQVSLVDVLVKSSSGRLFGASQAEFKVRLEKIKQEQFMPILSIISQQKNIEINQIEYRFPELLHQKTELFKQGARSAKEQAQAVSETLGVPLTGVYSLSPKWIEPNTFAVEERFSYGGKLIGKMLSTAPDSPGLKLITNYKGLLKLMLEAEFKVGEFLPEK